VGSNHALVDARQIVVRDAGQGVRLVAGGDALRPLVGTCDTPTLTIARIFNQHAEGGKFVAQSIRRGEITRGSCRYAIGEQLLSASWKCDGCGEEGERLIQRLQRLAKCDCTRSAALRIKVSVPFTNEIEERGERLRDSKVVVHCRGEACPRARRKFCNFGDHFSGRIGTASRARTQRSIKGIKAFDRRNCSGE
jgi:hypothetical protein